MGHQSSKASIEDKPCSACDGAEVYRPNFCYDPSLCRTPLHPCDTCNKLEAVEAQIQDSLNSLRKLVAEHHKIKTELNVFHSRITDKIPIEIMSRIFQFCTPALAMKLKANMLWPLPPTDIFSPLKIGAVCRGWRQIAWDTPQIWSYILISLRKDYHPQRKRLIQEWIYRSKALPLTLSLSESNFPFARISGDHDLSVYYPILEEVAKSSNRWSSVYINMQGSLMKAVLNNCRDLLLIRDISILSGLGTEVEGEVEEAVGPLWTTEPEPKSVSICGLLPVQVNVRWSGVTSLTVHGWTTYEYIEVIRNAPMLVNCTLRPTKRTRHIPSLTPKSPIVHSNIRTLKFRGTMKREYFFGVIAFPSLKNFEYDCVLDSNRSCSPSDVAAFQGFVTCSGSLLQSLKINGLPLTYDQLFDLLQAVPSLLNLHISPETLCDSIESFTKLLTHLGKSREVSVLPSGDDHRGNSLSAQSFLPHLRSFSCKFSVQAKLSWTLLPDVFGPPSEFLKPLRRPLKEFHVHDALTLTEARPKAIIPYDALLKIKDLNDAGANISYTGCGKFDLLREALDRFATGPSQDCNISINENYWPVIFPSTEE